ncbi:energy-coupling factor ABC transporter ATP-binding protein [Desulfatitalea tepidiphila]|uniref:energy-coupling factor ABC transporter ATP-binding protein n=1 Tax=Desulfatitalea tepidiphila TaxID=1185843 RepID=UPI0006B66E06|nr:ABC transporter ATP-binding protein [Desulfatitalea tepidiphila]
MKPPIETSHNFIEIKHLTHHFEGGTGGITDVSLNIQKGQFLLIAGANGSGKTTLLRHLNGLLLPQQGEVIVDGVSVRKDLLRARRKVGMVFQDSESQIVGQTVYEDVAFGPENLCWPREAIDRSVRQVLRELDLSDFCDQSPHLLSGGERRRLTIAGVLAMHPDVIVLDEPFANLDYPGVRQVLTHLLRLHQDGHTIVVAAHDLEKVGCLAQRLVIMVKGRIVADGPVMTVLPQAEKFDVRLPCAFRLGQAVTSWLN